MGFRLTPVATIFETLLPLNVRGADAVTNVRVGSDVRVTQHPIEIGSDVSDHAQVEGTRVSFDFHRSKTPYVIPASPLIVDTTIRFFEGIRGKLCTVVLPGAGTFLNMVLEHFDYPIDNYERIVISCVFRQINIADAISVPIPARLPAADLQVDIPTPIGAGAQATSTAATADVSLAATGLDALRGLAGS